MHIAAAAVDNTAVLEPPDIVAASVVVLAVDSTAAFEVHIRLVPVVVALAVVIDKNSVVHPGSPGSTRLRSLLRWEDPG